MKSLYYIILFSLSLNSINAQNSVDCWNVSSYVDGHLIDSFLIQNVKKKDTLSFYISDVIYVCKFRSNILIVDFQDKNIVLMPLMNQVISYFEDGDKDLLESILDSIKKIESEFQSDTSLSYTLNSNPIKVSYGVNGQISKIELIQTEFSENKLTHKLNKTVYEKVDSKEYSKLPHFSNYLQFKNGHAKLNKNFSDWEFFNLITE